MKAIITISVLFAVVAMAAPWPSKLHLDGANPVDAVPASFDCAVRKLAYTFGKQLLPRQGSFYSLHEALDLSSDTCHTSLTVASPSPEPSTTTVPEVVPEHAVVVAPGECIQTAIENSVAKAQAAADASAKPLVLLQDGTHYLKETLFINPEHSGLTMKAYPGASPVVSGGTALEVNWKAYNTTGGANVWVTDIKGQVPHCALALWRTVNPNPNPKVEEVPGLQLDGKRATRARYPNLPSYHMWTYNPRFYSLH